MVPGPAGMLEAAIDRSVRRTAPSQWSATRIRSQQGTMQNKVVTTLARAFAHLGARQVRFNFRGVGASAGTYAEGDRRARGCARGRARGAARVGPGCTLYLGGFSFGAAVALAQCGARPQPAGLVTVAPPVERLPPISCRRAALGCSCTAQPTTWCRSRPTRGWVAGLAAPPQLVLLDGVGHFFHGQLAALTSAVTGFFAPGALRMASRR